MAREEDDDDDLWLEFDCETSDRVAIIEDLGDSVWVFLTPPGESSIEQDCWLFNKPSAPLEPDVDSYRERSMPPPVPAQLIRAEGRREVPSEARFSARWSPDGHSVSIAIDGVEVAVASASLERGMSRYLTEECGWGSPWDDALLKRLFSA
jgi:hypothetical protein